MNLNYNMFEPRSLRSSSLRFLNIFLFVLLVLSIQCDLLFVFWDKNGQIRPKRKRPQWSLCGAELISGDIYALSFPLPKGNSEELMRSGLHDCLSLTFLTWMNIQHF